MEANNEDYDGGDDEDNEEDEEEKQVGLDDGGGEREREGTEEAQEDDGGAQEDGAGFFRLNPELSWEMSQAVAFRYAKKRTLFDLSLIARAELRKAGLVEGMLVSR